MKYPWTNIWTTKNTDFDGKKRVRSSEFSEHGPLEGMRRDGRPDFRAMETGKRRIRALF